MESRYRGAEGGADCRDRDCLEHSHLSLVE